LQYASKVLGRIVQLRKDKKSCKGVTAAWQEARRGIEVLYADADLKDLLNRIDAAIGDDDQTVLQKAKNEFDQVAAKKAKVLNELDQSLQRIVEAATASVGSPVLLASVGNTAGGPKTRHTPRTMFTPRTAFGDESRWMDRPDRWAKNPPTGSGIAWFGRSLIA
jgi:hypothetical protein